VVVVVQREPLYLRALLRFLRCLGYEAESLDALPHPPRASQVDVVIVDEDDLEVVPRGLRHRPRVVLGNGPPSAPHGQRAWVPKPFTGDELARAVIVARREQDEMGAAVAALSRDYEGAAVLLATV